jgi:hypothetical protein
MMPKWTGPPLRLQAVTNIPSWEIKNRYSRLNDSTRKANLSNLPALHQCNAWSEAVQCPLREKKIHN